VLRPDLRGEIVEERSGDLEDVAAALAHEVVMRPVRDVEHGTAGAELDAFDDADLDQAIEGAVHRALVELGVVGADGGDDVSGRHVMLGPAEEGVDDHASRSGDPHAPGAQSRDDIGATVSHHTCEDTERRLVASRSLLRVIRSHNLFAVGSQPCE
jgi:hypothetical protein